MTIQLKQFPRPKDSHSGKSNVIIFLVYGIVCYNFQACCIEPFSSMTYLQQEESLHRKNSLLEPIQNLVTIPSNCSQELMWHRLYTFFFLASAFQFLRPDLALCVSQPTKFVDTSGCDSLSNGASALVPEDKLV